MCARSKLQGPRDEPVIAVVGGRQEAGANRQPGGNLGIANDGPQVAPPTLRRIDLQARHRDDTEANV